MQYRNIYCALCNFKSVERLQCSDYLPSLIPRGDGSRGDGLVTFSLSFHFDLHELKTPSVDPISLHCESERIELPVGVVCGATVCPRGYTLHSYTCKANHYRDFPARSELGITTIVLCSISLLGLICRLILQYFWQQYKSFPGRMQFNLVLAMALYIALLLLSPLASDVDKLCFTLGVLKYFSFLASFVWMTCVAGDTWCALRRRRAPQHSQKRTWSPAVFVNRVVTAFGFDNPPPCHWFIRSRHITFPPSLVDVAVGSQRNYHWYCFSLFHFS